MTEFQGSELSARLRRLPAQLLLALLNATAILVIIAAIVALVALANTLREIKAGEHPALQSELAQLKDALTALQGSVDRLGSARSILTDKAIGEMGQTFAGALTKLRDCSASARHKVVDSGQMAYGH